MSYGAAYKKWDAESRNAAAKEWRELRRDNKPMAKLLWRRLRAARQETVKIFVDEILNGKR